MPREDNSGQPHSNISLCKLDSMLFADTMLL